MNNSKKQSQSIRQPPYKGNTATAPIRYKVYRKKTVAGIPLNGFEERGNTDHRLWNAKSELPSVEWDLVSDKRSERRELIADK